MVQLPSHSPFLFSSDEKFHHKEGEVLSSVLKDAQKKERKEHSLKGGYRRTAEQDTQLHVKRQRSAKHLPHKTI